MKKHHDQKQFGEERVYLGQLIVPCHRQPLEGVRQELKAGNEAEAMGMLLAGWLPQPCFLEPSRMTLVGVVPPTVG